MARPSSSKKVSRVASTGGGRAARSAKPIVWWAVMGLVVLLGITGVVLSRQDRQERGPATLTPPIPNQDHWHTAYGIYLCDEFAPPIQDQSDPRGIHTHADGIIHTHPFSSAAGGDNAVLDQFVRATGLTLTDSKIKVPGGKTFEEGKTECDGEPGIVQVKVDGEIVTEDVGDMKLGDRQIMTIAFAPEGAELPDPPSVPNLDNLTDVPPSEQQPPPPPPGGSTEDPAGTTEPGVEGGATTDDGGATGDESSDTSSPSTSAP